MKKVIFLLMIVFGMIFLSGCENNTSVYSDVTGEILQQQSDMAYSDLKNYDWSERYLNWCNQVKWYAPFIILISEGIGIFLVAVFKKSKSIRKTGLFVFIIGIPLVVLITVYGMCYLYGRLF